MTAEPPRAPTVSAVISSWNKKDDLRENLDALRAQTRKPDEIVLVDNRSGDGTIEMVRSEYPEVRLVVMPNSGYGACETFNIGFSTSKGDLVLILDDDVVLPPEWVEKMVERILAEPETTAIVSCKVVEPGMPDWYKDHPEVNRERYMATFRGCSSIARRAPLEKAGWYEEKLFIYGNERDLTARLLNAGHRVKYCPSIQAFHKTPFGMKTGRRSLYFHVRNLWWFLFRYCALLDIVAFVFRQIFPARRRPPVPLVESVGAIGGWKNVASTKGGVLVLLRATAAAFASLPWCLRRRQVCRAPDFSLPDQ